MSSLVNRRRSSPWIHRWSRHLIGAIAVLGAINTAYLTITRLTNTATTCPTSGCERVLESSYATVFGQPLALFGLLAYIGMAVFALGPLAVSPEQNRPLRTQLEKWTWLPLFIGATAMTIFSGYLMFIMFSQFVSKFGVGGICYFCVASAIFALSMFVLTLIGRDWDDIGQLLITGIVVAMVTIIATLAIFSQNAPSVAGGAADPKAPPPITTTSSSAEIELARHLKSVGAKMYGAYWCPHCHDQERLFGKEAFTSINYIECAPDGTKNQSALCLKIAPDSEKQTGQSFGFPTWEINGKYYPGIQTLENLAKISGYTGPRNFKNE
ncbi:vitamin K epoxide reductase family protein [Kovacikia minuta CCNUW1]|uniref:vitamin K epoxide reductase family protein n=1 Tax=Kovacikia minuta TaxID=2931930 RepID=UPI001CCFB57C|nr:vitamin K epoxide reductase family protein [Kovacikia minuta]UBF29047.1 vitamin K epoxide reductase family protein [Kovacikia minuta CCNUW1]